MNILKTFGKFLSYHATDLLEVASGIGLVIMKSGLSPVDMTAAMKAVQRLQQSADNILAGLNDLLEGDVDAADVQAAINAALSERGYVTSASVNTMIDELRAEFEAKLSALSPPA